MGFVNQLKFARLISARQFDRVIELCHRQNQGGEDPRLRCVAMLCLWWRGDRDRAFSVAQELLARHTSAPRSAIEIACSYYAGRPELPGAIDAMQRLAQLSPVAGSRLILSNSAWFAHSVSPTNGQQLITRVKSAVDDFARSRRAHVCWARAWLDADPCDRAQVSPPSI